MVKKAKSKTVAEKKTATRETAQTTPAPKSTTVTTTTVTTTTSPAPALRRRAQPQQQPAAAPAAAAAPVILTPAAVEPATPPAAPVILTPAAVEPATPVAPATSAAAAPAAAAPAAAAAPVKKTTTTTTTTERTNNSLPWIIGLILLFWLCFLLALGAFLLKDKILALVQPVAPPAAAPATAPTLGANGLVRRETGQGNALSFVPGEMVYGWKIVLSDEQVCDGGECFLANAPVGGSVTSGVINPWKTEIAGKTNSQFVYPTANPTVVPPVTMPITTTTTVSSTAVVSTTAPYNLPPQPQIGHPSIYIETGVPDPITGSSAHTKTWTIQVLDGTVAIVGGFTVDSTSNGVYKSVAGPTTLTTTVTDGFLLVTKADWANAEFCFRIAQAVQYGWANAHQYPLAGWTCQ